MHDWEITNEEWIQWYVSVWNNERMKNKTIQFIWTYWEKSMIQCINDSMIQCISIYDKSMIQGISICDKMNNWMNLIT